MSSRDLGVNGPSARYPMGRRTIRRQVFGLGRTSARRLEPSLKRKVLERSVPTHTVQPPRHNWEWDNWLRESASCPNDSEAVRASRPLVLSRTLFHDGRLSSECEQLGRLWVAFWAGMIWRFGSVKAGSGSVACAEGVSSGMTVMLLLLLLLLLLLCAVASGFLARRFISLFFFWRAGFGFGGGGILLL